MLILFGGDSALPAVTSTVTDDNNLSSEERGVTQGRGDGVVGIGGQDKFPEISIISGVMIYASIINALIGLFNLISAFPLDGGRMLRAGLIKWKKSYTEATRIAVRVGIGMSFGLMAFGFITIFAGSTLGGFWFIIIGWFIQSGAQTYLQQHELSTALVGVRLKDMMNSKFISVNQSQTVDEILRDYFNIYRKSEFPVLDAEGYLVGTITSRQAMGVAENDARNVKVGQIMTSNGELVIMNENSRADEALKRIYQEDKNRIFVRDDKDYVIIREQYMTSNNNERLHGNADMKINLLGIVSKTDLLNVASEREDFDRLANK